MLWVWILHSGSLWMLLCVCQGWSGCLWRTLGHCWWDLLKWFEGRCQTWHWFEGKCAPGLRCYKEKKKDDVEFNREGICKGSRKCIQKLYFCLNFFVLVCRSTAHKTEGFIKAPKCTGDEEKILFEEKEGEEFEEIESLTFELEDDEDNEDDDYYEEYDEEEVEEMVSGVRRVLTVLFNIGSFFLG